MALVAAVIVPASTGAAQPPSPIPGAKRRARDPVLRVMSFDLRYASSQPPNAWSLRRPVMRDLPRRLAPDLIGIQEGRYGQLRNIEADLPGYDWIGEGRSGGSRREFCALFYRKERLEPLEYDSFWLSDQPRQIGSLSPKTCGNKIRRLVTWVRFHDRRTRQLFYAVNTHLDFNEGFQMKSGTAILNQVRRFAEGAPVTTLTAEIVTDASPSGQYPSDHFPVMMELLVGAPRARELGMLTYLRRLRGAFH
ncbi:MAG: hypothetical protein H7Z41_12920 [Cytophagales bacterium]|nr:hypothetical protein [Armatimonadota bacterium]